MRRNNYVFLVGRILEYRERSITVQEEPLLLIELFLATDKPSISQPHPVLVRGHQAEELHYFLEAAKPELPDLMVLGWLRHEEQQVTIMAERTTVLVCPAVRQAAIEAIRQARSAQ